jgi:hypothetical protein
VVKNLAPATAQFEGGAAELAGSIRPCEVAYIHIEKAVETCARIAFAYGTHKAKSSRRAGREELAMRPCAGTVGRAVIGLTSVLGGCDAPTSASNGYAAHSNYGLLTILRRPRGCAGARFCI